MPPSSKYQLSVLIDEKTENYDVMDIFYKYLVFFRKYRNLREVKGIAVIWGRKVFFHSEKVIVIVTSFKCFECI